MLYCCILYINTPTSKNACVYYISLLPVQVCVCVTQGGSQKTLQQGMREGKSIYLITRGSLHPGKPYLHGKHMGGYWLWSPYGPRVEAVWQNLGKKKNHNNFSTTATLPLSSIPKSNPENHLSRQLHMCLVLLCFSGRILSRIFLG